MSCYRSQPRDHTRALSSALTERLFPALAQTSEYPVILSLENHCTVEQQKLMAHHMISILGGALLTQPLGDTMPTNFPSPEVGQAYAAPHLSSLTHISVNQCVGFCNCSSPVNSKGRPIPKIPAQVNELCQILQFPVYFTWLSDLSGKGSGLDQTEVRRHYASTK